MNRSKKLALLALLLAGCGGRAAPKAADAALGPDHQVATDSLTGQDRSGTDGPFKQDLSPGQDASGTLAFCKGPAMAEANNVQLKVTGIETHIDMVASCCPAGEVIDFKTVDAKGLAVKLSLMIARFPGTTLPAYAKLDLASPPAGWYFAIYCDQSQYCGSSHPTDSTFKGSLEISSLLGAPAVQITACVSATPKDPTNPYKKPVKLWASKVVINTVCVPGMDQYCNYDPKVSSLKGKCESDSTCTCLAGATKMANGKCQ